MKNKTIILAISTIAAAATCLILAPGCSSQAPNASAEAPVMVQNSSSFFPHVKKTGGEIWAENCIRCHYLRPSTQYSPAQWDVIVSHMRMRANLNGEEQRAVYQLMTGG